MWLRVPLTIGYLRTQGFIMDFPVQQVTIPGVALTLIPFETGNDVLEALNAGRIDVGETGEPQPIFAESGGLPVKVIAASAPARLTSLLVASNSAIGSLKDLDGKRIAFVRGTNTHWLVLRALQTAGLTQADIRPVLLTGNDALPALLSGQVDVIGLTAPTTQIALQQGARVLTSGEGLTHSSLYYLAEEKTIETKRPALDAFVRALSAHMAWIRGHTASRVAYLSPKLGIPPEILVQMSAILPDRLEPIGNGQIAAYDQQLADAFAAQKLIPKPIDAASELDGGFDKDIQP